MSFVPYTLGLIGLVITSIITVWFNQKTGVQIHSLIIFIIVPAGGMILGMAGSGGFYLGKKLTNTKMSKTDYYIIYILGLLTFISVNYISYKTTYLSINNKKEVQIKYYFSQPYNLVKISDLMTFGHYIKLINSGSVIDIEGIEIETGKNITTFLFYFQIIGSLLGAYAITLYLSNSEYCDKCKKYFKTTSLKILDLDNFIEFLEIINTIKDGDTLKKSINQLKHCYKAEKYVEILHHYCPSCHISCILIKFFSTNPNGESEEIENMQRQILLEQDISRKLLN